MVDVVGIYGGEGFDGWPVGQEVETAADDLDDCLVQVDASTEVTPELLQSLLVAFDAYTDVSGDDVAFTKRITAFKTALKAKNHAVYTAFLNADAERADAEDAAVVADKELKFASADTTVTNWLRAAVRDISNHPGL